MGYFSNGTEGLSFEEHFCSNCAHMPKADDQCCPVWSAHLFFAYELCNQKKHPGKVILDMLIERDEKGGQRCVMFIPQAKVGPKRHEAQKAELQALLTRCQEILKEAKDTGT